MHIDESKKFDKRNFEKNIKNGVIQRKELESYLSKLPDVSDKVFSLDEIPPDSEGYESAAENEISDKKKTLKKKAKGKAK